MANAILQRLRSDTCVAAISDEIDVVILAEASAGGKGGEERCGRYREGGREGGARGVACPDLLLYYGSLHNLPGLVHIVTHSPTK